MPDAPGLELIAQGINEEREGTVTETALEHGRATLIVNPEHVTDALAWLRDTDGQRYTFLSSLHAADYLPAAPRFAVHYELLEPRPRRAHQRQGAAPGPRRRQRQRPQRRRAAARDRLAASSSSRRPSSRSGRPTTSSGSCSGATPICAAS